MRGPALGCAQADAALRFETTVNIDAGLGGPLAIDASHQQAGGATS